MKIEEKRFGEKANLLYFATQETKWLNNQQETKQKTKASRTPMCHLRPPVTSLVCLDTITAYPRATRHVPRLSSNDWR